MTISDLFSQMAQNLSKVPAAMTDAEKTRLVRVANAGLGEFVSLLPNLRRTESKGVLLGMAQTLPITATNNSATIAFSPTWSAQADNLGRSVVVGGDPTSFNRLNALNTLETPYQGATGSTTLQVLSDAVLLGPFEDAVADDVILSWTGASDYLKHGLPRDMHMDQMRRVMTARPTHWWIESLNGISNADNPQYVLRLWPQPDAVYTLNFNRRLWPSALTVAMLNTNDSTKLPVTVREENHLINLCQEGLISSPLWNGAANKEDAARDAQQSRLALGVQTNNPGSTQPAMVRTPRFF